MKMYTPLVVLLVLALAGCASMQDKIDAARNAVDGGLVSGLNDSNKFNGITWRFPNPPLGPYTEVSGIEAKIVEGPHSNGVVVFFLGHSSRTKEWEVFSALINEQCVWKPLSVELPQIATAKTERIAIKPTEADLVVLCDVRVKQGSIEHIVKDVWKGLTLLPEQFRTHPAGQLLLESSYQPGTVVPRSALVCFMAQTRSENILTNNLGHCEYYVERGRVLALWEEDPDASVSIRTLKSQIKDVHSQP